MSKDIRFPLFFRGMLDRTDIEQIMSESAL